MKLTVKKICRKTERVFINVWMNINSSIYMKLFTKHLRKIGIHLSGRPNWISNDVYFDGSDYSIISIGEGCTISREVIFLTHDFSMHTVIKGDMLSNIPADAAEILTQKDNVDKLRVLGVISVGDYSFIGARATLLPGTHIGKNCIIGAGAVVKGNIPDGSIVIGNPAKVISSVPDWLTKKATLLTTK